MGPWYAKKMKILSVDVTKIYYLNEAIQFGFGLIHFLKDVYSIANFDVTMKGALLYLSLA